MGEEIRMKNRKYEDDKIMNVKNAVLYPGINEKHRCLRVDA